jgi:hypothetical protein
MNGFANILSILEAFRARIRSRARAKGWSKGSRLREVGVGSPGLVGRCTDGSCWRTEIFWTGRDYGYNRGLEDIPSRTVVRTIGGNFRITISVLIDNVSDHIGFNTKAYLVLFSQMFQFPNGLLSGCQ